MKSFDELRDEDAQDDLSAPLRAAVNTILEETLPEIDLGRLAARQVAPIDRAATNGAAPRRARGKGRGLAFRNGVHVGRAGSGNSFPRRRRCVGRRRSGCANSPMDSLVAWRATAGRDGVLVFTTAADYRVANEEC